MIYRSVIAIRTIMRTLVATGNDRTLDTGQGRQREVAYIENKIRPFVCRNASANPLNQPFFEMKTTQPVYYEFNAHVINMFPCKAPLTPLIIS
jgi:hypothetical protein